MSKYITYYYCLPGGRVPVKDFVDSFDTDTYRRFIFKKELLEEFGPKLPMPHAKYFGGRLYDLRFSGTDGIIRILYFFAEKHSIVLLHEFIKKTQKMLKRELRLAYRRMKDYLG